MAGKFPQPSHEPPFQAEGLSMLTAGSGWKERGLMAGESLGPNYQDPEAPYMTN